MAPERTRVTADNTPEQKLSSGSTDNNQCDSPHTIIP